MFQRILVPLDGSTRAESAVPIAARLAQASGGSVILMQVAEPPVSSGKFSAPEAYPKVGTDEELAEATEYLKILAQSSALSGIATEVHALVGAVAPTILAATQSLHADLVVLCSHGYTGFKRWRLGSIAHKLVPHSPVPVLILREGGPDPTAVADHPLRALVPLDGSPLSELALLPAAQLVAALTPAAPGVLQLLRVVDIQPSYGKFRGIVDTSYDTEVRAEVKREDEQYLQAVARRFAEGELAKYNLAVHTTVLINPDVAEAIVEAAEQAEGPEHSGAQLIVMATHGRGGLQHWVLGSVAERVLHATKLPLLIVHAARGAHGTHKGAEAVV
jgi:nucleotide-binding universal stress UspA family protein